LYCKFSSRWKSDRVLWWPTTVTAKELTSRQKGKDSPQKEKSQGKKKNLHLTASPCIRLERGKFESTNQDSAGGKNSSVLM